MSNLSIACISLSFNQMISPRNPLVHRTLERTAAVYTTVTIINNLFLSSNDIIDLTWYAYLFSEYSRLHCDATFLLFFCSGSRRRRNRQH